MSFRFDQFQYEYFFENGEVPAVREQAEQTCEAVPRTQTNLLLDNVSKIECKLTLNCLFD